MQYLDSAEVVVDLHSSSELDFDSMMQALEMSKFRDQVYAVRQIGENILSSDWLDIVLTDSDSGTLEYCIKISERESSEFLEIASAANGHETDLKSYSLIPVFENYSGKLVLMYAMNTLENNQKYVGFQVKPNKAQVSKDYSKGLDMLRLFSRQNFNLYMESIHQTENAGLFSHQCTVEPDFSQRHVSWIFPGTKIACTGMQKVIIIVSFYYFLMEHASNL